MAEFAVIEAVGSTDLYRESGDAHPHAAATASVVY